MSHAWNAGFLVLFCFYEAYANFDPCRPENNERFPEHGSRNTRCTSLNSICDYYLHPGWYFAKESLLVNTCPPLGSCGVVYPVWMNGDFPEVTDGIVNKTVCIVRKEGCCEEQLNIKVKNCSGFYVYFLPYLNDCPSAYCFESALSCNDSSSMSYSTGVTETSTLQDAHSSGHSKDSRTQNYDRTTTNSLSSSDAGSGHGKTADRSQLDRTDGLLIALMCCGAVLIVLTIAITFCVIKLRRCRKLPSELSKDAVSQNQPQVKNCDPNGNALDYEKLQKSSAKIDNTYDELRI